MKIKSVRLKNFQGYKDTKIEFEPTFNVIVGRNESGKSSIVRALNFVFSNEWSKDFVRDEADETQIVITLDSGVKIFRTKGNATNRCTIKYDEDKKEVFENFGTTLPQKVSEALEINPLKLDEHTEINMAVSSQHDGLFLLQEPGTLKAKLLGKISGLHYIDFALRDIAKDKKNLSIIMQEKNNELQLATKELEQFEDVNIYEKQLKTIDEEIKLLQNNEKQLNELKVIDFNLKELNIKIAKLDDYAERYEKVNFDDYDKLAILSNKIDMLNVSVETIENVDEQIELKEKQIKSLQQDMDKIVDQYVLLLKSSKTCPVCSAEITSGQVKKIVEEINA
jgi:exonuclease SbcC